MSKKLLSVMLALVMVLSVFSVAAFAANAVFEDPDAEEAYTQMWYLETTNEPNADGDYTVDVYLEANYAVGAISFHVDAEGATLKDADASDFVYEAEGYNASVNVNKEEGNVYIIPEPTSAAAKGLNLTTATHIATLTYTLTADTATITLVNDAFTIDNDGKLIAARLGDGVLASNTMYYGQWVVDAEYLDVAIGDPISEVMLGEESAVEYTVSFDANGGTGAIADVVMEAGDYTLPENTFTAATGYAFKAWDVNGTEYAPGTVIAISADTTVKAVWEMLTPELVVAEGYEDSVIIDTNKTFGGTYAGTIYGFEGTSFRAATYLTKQLAAVNGTIATVQTPYNTAKTFGTGATVQLKNLNGDVVATYVVVIFGDVDCNGTITATDVQKMVNFNKGSIEIPASPIHLAAQLFCTNAGTGRALNASDAGKFVNFNKGTETIVQSTLAAKHAGFTDARNYGSSYVMAS